MGPIRRGEHRNYLLEFRDSNNNLAPVGTAEIEARFTTRAGTLVKQNANAGGSSDEIEDVSTGVVRVKVTIADTESMAAGLVRGEIWYAATGEERSLIGTFTTNVF